MAPSGARFDVRQGWFEETVPKYASEDPVIALLRLDGDWYDSTSICLEHLFPRVSVGGLVIIDDYGQWDGCTRAVHDYLSSVSAVESIASTRSGVTFIRKR